MRVGLFDSGIGGLTVLSKLVEASPGWEYVYLADTLRAPFGTKPREELLGIVVQDLDFLISKKVDIVVAACNTADSVIKEFSVDIPVPYVGIIDSAVEMSRGKKVAVLATDATVRSGIYVEMLRGKKVFQKSAQLLVAAIESDLGNEKILDAILRSYLLPVKRWKPDELILGCTHFPLLKSKISSLLGIRILDPADGIVEKLKSFGKSGRGKIEFYVTGDVEDFKRKVKRLGILKGAGVDVAFRRVKLGEEAGGDIGVVWGG